ncbi:hypothetical protein [Mesorhizobium sp. L103C105A0]|uniref:hypothetical protein n=1 Tax=Mesorhizobium sp. L103C105A0 TaxID=1287074 RepID=UPI0012DD4F0D|nr:hypothetical protein [Mesorhizobium sp. L103C105A0]
MHGAARSSACMDPRKRFAGFTSEHGDGHRHCRFPPLMLAVVEQLADHGANREAHRSRISRLDLDHHFGIASTATEGRRENKREDLSC